MAGTTVVQAKTYFNSRENILLVPNRNFGNRKYINVPMQRQLSMGGKKGNNKWVHPSEALLRGHIVYNVKFLGHVEVDLPKGTDVVKEAIRKMKFNKQIKKAEGQKPPKVELTISIDGVTVQEPKYKVIQHQYPLHRISYCADDKSDKRMFTFIAKESDCNTHHCFVFDSEKCAEEITLTVGQAFDLAYRRFLESSGKDMDTKKQYLLAQKKIQQLTQENLELKARVADLERLVDSKVLRDYNSTTTTTTTTTANGNHPEVGRKLENLIMDDFQTNGAPPAATHSDTSPTPVLAPPPPVPSRSTPQKNNTEPAVDLFGSPPFKVEVNPVTSPSGPPSGVASPISPPPSQNASYRANPFNNGEGGGGAKGQDPFGMGSFNPTNQKTSTDIDKQIEKVDQELLDLQDGFSQGLSFGTADFSLDDLDPLKK